MALTTSLLAAQAAFTMVFLVAAQLLQLNTLMSMGPTQVTLLSLGPMIAFGLLVATQAQATQGHTFLLSSLLMSLGLPPELMMLLPHKLLVAPQGILPRQAAADRSLTLGFGRQSAKALRRSTLAATT